MHVVAFKLPWDVNVWGSMLMHNWMLPGCDQTNMTEPFKWLHQNTSGAWHFKTMVNLGMPDEHELHSKVRSRLDVTHLCFYFEHPDDAIRFKLTWL